MEGDAAARADLLRAKVVDRDGAAHVAVEGERHVVLKWEIVSLEFPSKIVESEQTDLPIFGGHGGGLLRGLCGGLVGLGRFICRIVGALATVRPVSALFVFGLVNQR